MMYNGYPMYGNFQQPYYPNNGAMPDQLAQLRGGQQQYQPTMPTMPTIQQNAQPQSNNDMIWVQGIEAAKAYQIPNGNTVVLWDSESQSIYIKSVDNSGMPTMRVLDWTERDIAPKTPIQTAEYITREEFNALEAKIDDYMNKKTAAKSTTRVKEENDG